MIEASGILESGPDKASTSAKDKSNDFAYFNTFQYILLCTPFYRYY